MNYINEFSSAVYALFLEMAPYLILGLAVTGLLSVLVKKEFVARHIGHSGFSSVFKAALLGVPLPLCSCGVVPTSGYLKNAGASRPSLVSFLISTPQTGVDSIAATYGMLGPFFAFARPVIALLTGLAGGAVSALVDRKGDETGAVEAVRPESEVAAESGELFHVSLEPKGDPVKKVEDPREKTAQSSVFDKLKQAANYGFIETIDDIAPHFIMGLIIAGLITLIIPDGFFEGTIIADGFAGMLLMVVIGVPMYVCSTSSIPVAVALIAKGISPGAAYVFLVAGPATNAATLMILNRVLGLKHTLVYLFTIVAGSLVFGPLVNVFADMGGWTLPAMVGGHEAHLETMGWLNYSSSALLLVLIVYALYKRYSLKLGAAFKNTSDSLDHSEGGLYKVINVQGMTCNHCAANVENAVKTLTGVRSVKIDLAGGLAKVDGDVSAEALLKAIDAAGYKAST